MMKLGLLLGCAALLVSGAPATGQSFKSGNWSGSVHRAADGSFSHCTIITSYNSGTAVTFAVDGTMNWRIGFANPQWSLTPGSQIALDYWVDGASARRSSARVASKSLAIIDLPPEPGLFDLFRRGARLTASVVGGPQLTFNLTGTSVALQALLDCAGAKGQYPNSAPAAPWQAAPVVTPAPPTSAPPPQRGAQQMEAMRIVANLIAPVGLREFRVLGADEVARLGVKSDAVWMAQGVFGTLDILAPSPGLTVEIVASQLIADDGASCKGEFLSGSTPDPESSGRIRRLYSMCRQSQGNTINTFYTIASRADGGFIKMGLLSAGEAEPARTAETQLRGVVFKGL